MQMKSLTVKLLGICSGTLIIMFLACLCMFLWSSHKQTEAVKHDWLTLVTDVSSNIGTQFSERYQDAKVFSQNYALQSRNPNEMIKALNAYVLLADSYDMILFVDLSGQVIASNTLDRDSNPIDVGNLYEQNFSNAPWFTNTVNERFTENSNKSVTGVFFEDFMIDPVLTQVYKSKRLGVSFSTPVRDEKGKMIGVLTNRSRLSWIENEFEGLYKRLKDTGYKTMEMTLLNKKGEVVIDYDPSKQSTADKVVYDLDRIALKFNLSDAGSPAAQMAIKGERGTVVAQHVHKGYLQLAAFTPIKNDRFPDDLSWSVLFRMEEDVLMGSIFRGKELFFVVCGIVLFTCVSVSGFFALRLSQRLRKISENISTAGNSVDTVSMQLSNASQELSSGATEVASSLEETVSSLEELTSMVKTNAENAGEAASLAQNSSKVAKEGETEVQNLIGAISKINQSSKKIEEIINVIDDIAFQTNLLALNAAVEAARAGEQGKGFAVVAEAVRNLAQRSGTAAKEITSLIRDNVEKIDHGTKIADRSGQVLQNILASVRKVADLNNEIAAASKEQSSGLIQISKAMNEIDQATQRNAAASEEVASSSEEMSHQSTILHDMMVDLSSLVSGTNETLAVNPSPAIRSASTRPAAKVTPLKRPPQTRKNRPAAQDVRAQRAPHKAKSYAETVIPFGDEGEEEPPAKISSTAGF